MSSIPLWFSQIMNKDDFFYLSVFYVAIAAGYFDRKIESKNGKQLYGAMVGLILSFVSCGSETLLILINILVNAWIITFCGKNKCHILSFIFTFSYLFYSRKFADVSFTNVMLMSSTLKMVGVAFEVNAKFLKNGKKHDKGMDQSNRFEAITFTDIVSYGINYIGLLGAPYYTYLTYEDFLKLPFKRYHDWKNLCIYKLVSSTMVMSLYLITINIWPISYAFTMEFDEKESLLYRIFYVYPTAYSFLLRIWNALILLECCCCMNGLGAYPISFKPKCGYGPTKQLDKLTSLKNEGYLRTEEYSFATVENVNILKFHSELGFGRAIQYWNTTIQFWLYTVIYKNIPYAMIRKPATMFISSYWHGLDFGYFASLFFSSLVLVVDKRWRILLEGKKSFQTRCCLLLMKLHILNNLIATFIWKHQENITKYQSSVYYNGILLLVISYILLLTYERKKL